MAVEIRILIAAASDRKAAAFLELLPRGDWAPTWRCVCDEASCREALNGSDWDAVVVYAAGDAAVPSVLRALRELRADVVGDELRLDEEAQILPETRPLPCSVAGEPLAEIGNALVGPPEHGERPAVIDVAPPDVHGELVLVGEGEKPRSAFVATASASRSWL